MKKLGLLIFSLALAPAFPAMATDIMIPATMQRCAADADCTMVSNSCEDSCADLPVNKANVSSIDSLRTQRCGAAKPAEGVACNTNPPLESSCINNRCTIGYAYKNHGDAQDYQSGAYPVPEKAVPAPQGTADYSGVDDRDGSFSAYDLPNDIVRQNALGQYNFPAATAPTPSAAPAPTNAPAPAAPAQQQPVPGPQSSVGHPQSLTQSDAAAPAGIEPAAGRPASAEDLPPIPYDPDVYVAPRGPEAGPAIEEGY